MRYHVVHETRYVYDSPASLCHNIIVQEPKNQEFQQVESYRYIIDPKPHFAADRVDFFENAFTYFAVQKTHQELIVTSESTVKLSLPRWAGVDARSTPPWEEVAQWLKSVKALNDTRQFYLESPHVYPISGLVEYAQTSFTPGRPILEAAIDLNTRIFDDFEFTSGFTDISTPLGEVFASKKGVCQDFAHFGLACLRSIGLSARYVSGYIETLPPPGQPKLQGADASHAWIALFVPDLGWVELDATNNLIATDQHVRVAVGRDFSDVVPLKGIVYSGGDQEMIVKVDVNRFPETA
ncbi:MAG: transglutaminase family protein [Bacteroidota bacterium]